MGADALAQVLRPLALLFPAANHPDLLVGLDGADDAAVYRLAEDLAIVVTADFFPPVVDDPYQFGAIAAANAMSDVFAMGGEVLLALNLLGLPEDLDLAVAAEIIRGGAEMVQRAGGVIAGGHSVVDHEPKYGLAVVGRVDPARCLRKAGARPGDVLVLTKPIGTGLVTTALKRGLGRDADVAAAIDSMLALNQAAGRAAGSCAASAATDITGFGLLGHGLEMAERSGVALRIDPARLPLLPGALDYAAAGIVPGGTGRNRAAFEHRVAGLEALPPAWGEILFDPQTSGGLLIAIAPEHLAALLRRLAEADVTGHVIGGVEAGEGVVIGGAPA